MLNVKKVSISLVIAAFMLCGVTYGSGELNNYAANTSMTGTNDTQGQIKLDDASPMADYIAQSRRKIKDNWYPPTSSFEHTATVNVTIDRKGQLLNCAITESSSDEGFDNSLLKAVKKTKFSPLPDEITDNSVIIHYTFNMQKRQITNRKGE